MSLAFGLGLLFLLFRQIERWLHQHIFKVSWLLSDSFQVTTLLYYILFLPGIVLHELALWLGSLALRARAKRRIEFPAAQDIGELRLNFIRLPDDAGLLKRFVISLCPLAAGMFALWLIAAHVFRWDVLLALTAAGSLDAIGAALNAFLRTADVWLWFYLAFAIANTMFPWRAIRRGKRESALVACVAPLLAFGIWRIGGAATPALAELIEALMSGIGLIIAQITAVNLFALAILGLVEALVEGLTQRSASFRDGKMITLTAGEAREDNRQEQPFARPSQLDQPKRPPKTRSIYDLKLPIPGPPGQEPVSRSAVAILNLDEPAKAENSQAAPGDMRRQKAADPGKPSTKQATQSDADDLSFSADAPFERPFVARGASEPASEELRMDEDSLEPEPFARPFVMASPASPPVDAASQEADAQTCRSQSQAERPAKANPALAEPKNRTRPAPKPSQREPAGLPRDIESAGDELVYEAFDDDEPYGRGDEG